MLKNDEGKAAISRQAVQEFDQRIESARGSTDRNDA